MELTAALRAAVLAHAAEVYPREACGLVVEGISGAAYRPCENTALAREAEFRIAPSEWLEAERTGRVVAVVHSHPDGDYRPSATDMAVLEAGSVPWVIVGYPSGLFSVTAPVRQTPPLLGRQFQHGYLDCFTLLRDHYRQNLGVVLPDVWNAYDWWDEGQNLYLDHYAAAGFEQVNCPLEPNDVILMRVASRVPNHVGVYLDEGVFIHHLANQLSRREHYTGVWQRATHGIFRYRGPGQGTASRPPS